MGILKALGNPGGAIILALGRADVGFWWNVVWAISIVAALTVGLVISPSAHTAVYILLGLSITVGMCWHVLISNIAKVDYWPIVKHFLKLFSVAMAIGWFGYYLTEMSGLSNSLVRVVTGGIVCGPLYAVYLLLFEKPMFQMLRSRT